MDVTKYGLILNVENYAECVAFYRDVLGLTMVFSEAEEGFAMTCFAFGSGYLMVENGGLAAAPAKSIAQSPVKLRFNVEDVEAAAVALRTHGVALEIETHDWGTTAEFHDPDGNRCALRSEDGSHGAGDA